MNPRPKFNTAQRAGILCNDPRFQRFVATRTGLPTSQASTSQAAEYVRQICKVQSRADLDKTIHASDQFGRLVTEFDAWRGRIPAQR